MQRSLRNLLPPLFVLLGIQLVAQNVGIETNNPDSTLSIKNKVEIGGTQGDLLFTDDLGSITFPTTVLPNAPMINMFTSGTSNDDRMVIAHSANYPDWGLMYRDDLDQFRFGVSGSSTAVTIGVGEGHLAVGEVDLSFQSTLIAASSNDITTGHFINTNTTDPSVNAVYGSASGTGTGVKRGGFFEALQGTGRAYGIHATSALADTNIAIYGNVGFLNTLPGDVNRAGWFDDGDVVVDEQMLIGSSSLGDVPHASALLELNSTTRGLLFPRMTSTQRLNISSPAEGLVVYDTDQNALYYFSSGSWQSFSGGGGSGHWLEDTPNGIYYNSGNVGIGVSSVSSSRRLDVQTSSDDFGGYFYNDTNSSGTTMGVSATAIGTGSGDKRAGSFDTQAGLGTNYGVWARALNGGTAIGLYATANGAETNRSAWFDQGEVVVDEDMLIGSSSMFDEPDGSAILELNSTSQGFLLPRMTSTQRTSIGSPAEGLLVYDTTDDDVYVRQAGGWLGLAGGGGGGSLWTDAGGGNIYYDGGHIGMGSSMTPGYILLNIDNDDQIAVDIYSEYTGTGPKIGIQSIVDQQGSALRYGIYSLAVSPSAGSAAAYGIYGDASQGSSSGPAYGVYGDVSGTGSGERWAGYFDGDTRVNDQLVVGSETPGSPEPSAILDLQSIDKGLLPPRMTTSQRTSIASPAEGLVVYDSDANGLFLHDGSAWGEIGSGGGGGGLWLSSGSPSGPYVGSDQSVGIGDTPQFFRRAFITTSTGMPYGLEIENAYTGGLGKYGLYVEASSAGTNTRYGIYSKAWANVENDPAYGIYAEGNQGTTDATVYGIFATAPGTGTGDRWAGWFDGNVRATEELTVDGNVGVGDNPSPISRMYLDSGDEAIGVWINNSHTGSVTQYNIYSNSNMNGTGARYAFFGTTTANSADPSPAYGVHGEANQGSSPADVYGVYGKVTGSGTGERWAGYFQGNTKIEDDLNLGVADKIRIQPLGFQGAGEIEMYDDDGTKTVMIRANQDQISEGAELLLANDLGAITVELDGEWDTQGGGYLGLENDNSERTIMMFAEEAEGQGSSIHLFNNAGVRTIEFDADFGGDGRVITDELEITGGSDLAEYFATAGNSSSLSPGSVVIIDSSNPGQVRLSGTAYDKKVVGIVSGANGIKPGMMMGQKGSIAYGDVPVAVAGRVYVKVDETNGIIEPGDFLTTSDNDGFAMRVDDWEKARGAILGKALTAPDANGFVLVLVHLQ